MALGTQIINFNASVLILGLALAHPSTKLSAASIHAGSEALSAAA